MTTPQTPLAPNPAPAWTFERPWRNNNPGDLRCLPDAQKWDGQIGVDTGPGGPFAIFENRTKGWRALAVCLLTYYRVHGLNTVASIFGRYAPPSDGNNTQGYIDLVCSQISVDADEVIDPSKVDVMLALVSAVSLAEGSARIRWYRSEKLAGVQLAIMPTNQA